VSVGEWLNGVIRQGDADRDDEMRFADYDDDYEDDGRRDEPRQRPQRYSRESERDARGPQRQRRQEYTPDYSHARDLQRELQRDLERESAQVRRDLERDLERNLGRNLQHHLQRGLERENAIVREEFGDVNARLDRLTNQLERIAQSPVPAPAPPPAPLPLTGAPLRGRAAPAPQQPRHAGRPPMRAIDMSVDDAVAEIAERQRALYGEAITEAHPHLPEQPSPPMAPQPVATQPIAPQPVAPRPVAPQSIAPGPMASQPMVPHPAAPQAPPVYSPAAPPVYAPPPAYAAPQTHAPAPAYAPPKREPEPQIHIGQIEEQLRSMAARLDSLRPNGELGRAIAAIHSDLDDIRRQLTEAQPRHVVQSLESEAQALAERVDYSRYAGVDAHAIAGIEQGLAEVRDALHGLTPAESLVGFDETVRALSQKVDMIIARENPAAIEQLEAAIGTLHSIVAHVASNDTLNKVAEDIRSLAGQIDALAQHAASGHALSALESRIDTLTNALGASVDAGQSVPRDLEKLLTGLIEKLEWVQLTHTDQAAMGNLEDRIAQLVKRLDTSDAKLGNLQAVERGLADLLVHLDQIRDGNPTDIKQSVQRTQDSLEAVHGTVEQVVDRLAHIESGIQGAALRTSAANQAAAAPAPAAPTLAEIRVPAVPLAQAKAEPIEADFNRPLAPAARPFESILDPMPAAPEAEAAPRRPDTGAPRKPIDPNLPPDHPLEPGLINPSRGAPSAAERIAASEATAGYGQPPVVGEGSEKTNFVAAARRAAQAAAAAAPEKAPRTAIEGLKDDKKTPRLRKLLVAGGALLVVYGGVRVATHMVADNGPAALPPPAAVEQTAPPAVLPETNKQTPPSGPLILPVPGANETQPPRTTPGSPLSLAPQALPAPMPAAAPMLAPMPTPMPAPMPAVSPAPAPMPAAHMPVAPARQSALETANDVTGSLSRQPPAPTAPPAIIAPAQSAAPAIGMDKLPATIGGPTLRAAALAGDATAEFEVATRFAEGHGVPPSNEQAARWLERAAKQGLTPAQFRLGGFFEKGIGVKKDLAVARDYYKAAADKGNGKAMHNLAVLYAEGINGPSDYRSAARWFRAAADHGIADSQYNLAILYARGIGVEQNYAESYKWFVLAANQGDSEAAKKRDEVATHLDAQSLAAAQAVLQKWTPAVQPDEAVNVKTPPGGWEPQTPPTAKSKVRVIGAKAATPDSKVN
jgi:localization factor PodJL